LVAPAWEPGRLSQLELAERIGVTPSVVVDMLDEGRRPRFDQKWPPAPS
jgi:predicted transcriptional regulator